MTVGVERSLTEFLSVTGSDEVSAERWNGLLRELQARLNRLEVLRAGLEGVIAQSQSIALDRINAILDPATTVLIDAFFDYAKDEEVFARADRVVTSLNTAGQMQGAVIPPFVKRVAIDGIEYKRADAEPAVPSDEKLRSEDRWLSSGALDLSHGGWWQVSYDAINQPMRWSNTADAPRLSTPDFLRRLYVDVGAYCPLNDTVNAHAAVQAAFNDGAGREIVFTHPVGGTRAYLSKSRGSGRLYMPRKGRIIFEPGAVLDFEGWGRSGTAGPYLYAAGVSEPAVSLGADALNGSFSLSLLSGQGAAWSRGDYGYLVSDAMFTVDDGGIGTRGEWVSVLDVSGDTLTLGGFLRDNYLVSDNARLHRISDPAQTIIENPQIIGAGRFSADVLGDRGIQINNGVGCRIEGGYIKYADFMGVMMKTVLNGTIDGVLCEMEGKGSNEQNQYPFAIVDGCEATEVTNCDALGGKEGYALSVSGLIQGITRDIVFANNRARGAWRSGYCTHSNHIGLLYEGNIAEDCEQGFDIRITDAHLTGNIIRRMGRFSGSLNCGIQLGSGSGKVRLNGNYYEDVLRGVWMPSSIVHEFAPGDITMKGEVMRGVKARGVLLDYRVSPGGGSSNPSGALGVVSVTDCDIDCVTSGSAPAGIEMHGKWTAPVLARNTIRGGAGLGTRSITLHATSNGGGTNGPINPVIVDNEYSTGYLSPAVSHASGIVKIDRNRGIGQWGPGETIRASKSHNFGAIAGGAFESTTVTVVGARAGDRTEAWMSLTAPGGVWFRSLVTADDEVTVYCINFTSGSLDPVTGTLYVEVTKA